MFGSENKITNLLKLDKPLVIFDLEATGPIFSKDKIVEIAYTKISPGKKIAITEEMVLNPETEIPPEASQIHGITEEDVKGKPTFRQMAQKIWDIFNKSYYAGYSITNFDLPLLKREFLRVGMDFNYKYEDIIDSRVIFDYMEPRNLSIAYKFYCGKKEIDKEHMALTEVKAETEILKKQLKKYKEVRDIDFIKKIHKAKSDRFVDNTVKFYWQGGEAYLAFGKHKGKPLRRVVDEDREYLKWILEADFSEETKNIITESLKPEKIKGKQKGILGIIKI